MKYIIVIFIEEEPRENTGRNEENHATGRIKTADT